MTPAEERAREHLGEAWHAAGAGVAEFNRGLGIVADERYAADLAAVNPGLVTAAEAAARADRAYWEGREVLDPAAGTEPTGAQG